MRGDKQIKQRPTLREIRSVGRCCVAGFLLYVAMVSGHGAVKTAPYKFSTAEVYILYAPALGSNNAAARYAKYSAKHIHPCPRFSLYLHSGGSNSTSAMAAQTGTS